MKDPKICLERLRTLFAVGCIFMGGYMTLTQSVGFLENRDSSSITYKHFNKALLDVYPTFSICLSGSEIYWKNETLIFDKIGITSSQYMDILKGHGARYEMNGTTGL